MPRFVLFVKATLENVEELAFNKSEINWCLDLQDPTGSETKSRVTVDPNDAVAVDGSRGTANLCLKWPGTTRAASLSVVDVKGTTRDAIQAADSDEWVPLIAFECRGLEPTACHTPLHGISAKSSAGTFFREVVFEDGCWAAYCEKANEPVSAMDIAWKIERA